jgi:hypothetical protein
MNARLIGDKTKVDSCRVRCQDEMTMRLQMSKQSPKTTLGDLQGDQSEVQLSKSLSFIISQEE